MPIEFTVFTPTFNRSQTLQKSYAALCNQTCKDFIWLIVDDGSTDETAEIVAEWKKENKIEIIYIYQENAGKQRAVNTGIKNCRTKYFGFLDSDDYYCQDTVENFLKFFSIIENNNHVAGIMARRGTDENTPIGSSNLPVGQYIENFDKLIRKYNFYGDTCRAYKTDILKEYLYPNISDKFILESVMLSAIDRKYDLLIVNEVFSISKYLNDGYTNNSERLYKKNPYGYALGISMIAAAKRGILRQIKYTMMFTVWCWKYRLKSPYKMAQNKTLFIMCLPFSIFCFFIKYPKWFFTKEEDEK